MDIANVLSTLSADAAVTFNAAGSAVSVTPTVAQGGFGCLGCSARTAPPITQGFGEFFTYGLVFVGFLGYRRRITQK